MAGAFGQSAGVRIENNLIDGEGNAGADGINIDASEDISITGNIITRTTRDAIYTVFNSSALAGKFPVLNESDYNIYDSSFQIIADRFSGSDQSFGTLFFWNLQQAANITSLNVDNPDGNSINQDITGFFVDLAPARRRLGFCRTARMLAPIRQATKSLACCPTGLCMRCPGYWAISTKMAMSMEPISCAGSAT